MDFVHSRGFAFVTFASVSNARKAIKHLNGVRLLGKNIRVEFATSNAPSAASDHRERRKEAVVKSASGKALSAKDKIRAMEAKLEEMKEEKFKIVTVDEAKGSKS